MRKLLVLPLSALLLVLGFGCGGESDPTDREITDAELVAMVLPQEELGSDYADFELDEDSGFGSNEDRIEDSWDEEDEAEDVERFGRTKGYRESYSSFAALLRGEGPCLIGTSVALYEDADGAGGDLNDDVEDRKKAVGTVDEDVTLEDAEEFEPDRVADEAAGLEMALSFADGDGTTMHGTVLGFRRGRLIGSVIIARFDEQDVREEAEELARKLDERIQAVLRGEIEPEGTPTPEPTLSPGAEVAPSSLLESFRFRSEMSVEVDGGFEIEAEGAFEAPHSLSCTLTGTFAALTFREGLVLIGDDAWFDDGSGLEEADADDPDVVDALDLCPGSPVFWEDFDFLSDTGGLQGLPETKNGVASLRYPLGEAFEALGSVGFLPPEVSGVTVSRFDVWLAEDGGWPVALDVDMSADSQAFAEVFGLPLDGEAGQQARIRMLADITDANDPGISVETPAP